MTHTPIGPVSLRECPRLSGPSQPLELTLTTPCLEPCQRPPCREPTSAYLGGSAGCQSSRCSTSRDASAVRNLPPSQRREMSTTSGSRPWPLRGRYDELSSPSFPKPFSCPRCRGRAPTDVQCVVRRSVMAWTQSNFVEDVSASPSRASAIEATLEVTLEESRSQRDRTPPSLFGL